MHPLYLPLSSLTISLPPPSTPPFYVALVGPINREMRHLISSLQNHNHQLKGDLQRYKRKLRETQLEINKVCVCVASLDRDITLCPPPSPLRGAKPS